VGKETSQRLGIEGVQEIKEWLEATTRFAFTYTVYDSEPMCTVICQNGDAKALDLEGNTTSNPKRPISVECKKYSTVGDQASEFRKFLAIAYSSTAKAIAEKGGDWQREFMWVTYHPFAQTNWKNLLTLSYMKGCVEEHKALLGGEAIDDDLLSTVASRTWVMVVQQRQVGIRLSKDELAVVNTALVHGGFQK
jgi:hypothetical protein